jgi:hypothetical protein
MSKYYFCNFCKSMEHEENECRTLDIMRERTPGGYKFQGEDESESGVLQYNILRGYHQRGR